VYVELEFFENQLDFGLRFFALLLRVIDFSQDFQQTLDPWVRSVENLNLGLGRFL
jgi:hypothetical protein